MRYDKICKGIFLERPNRFVAYVEIEGKKEKVHVKNTGRCKDLLVTGTVVYLEDHICTMRNRKLRYSLITVEKQSEIGMKLVNMDSQAPNKVVREALENGTIAMTAIDDIVLIKGEYGFGDSRMDFYLRDGNGREGLLEIKGVTLEDNGTALFPDAPTERGLKHINELIKAAEEGYYAGIIFVIQMKGVEVFKPNYKTHAAFGNALKTAKNSGVEIMAYDCKVESDMLSLDMPVEIIL